MREAEDDDTENLSPTGNARRRFLVDASVLTAGAAVVPYARAAESATEARPATINPVATPVRTRTSLIVNGQAHELELDARSTLLDVLRENLRLTGTKKGCDRGQCGACTVLVNGRRINSCLALAVSLDGDEVTTIEGLGSVNALHPMQKAFVTHDAFQCGYCTPGQVCSAVALLGEAKAGMPSAVTTDVRKLRPVRLNADEIRERMSGNICRCGAYVNIVDAVASAARA